MTILICKASASKLAIDGTGPLKEGPKNIAMLFTNHMPAGF